jgi:hypothetical protein
MRIKALCSPVRRVVNRQIAVVEYRSKLHATLERNFRLMPAAKWLKLLTRLIPDRYEHLVGYCGYTSQPKSRTGRGATLTPRARSTTVPRETRR